jgi:hypothetical protein
MEVGEEQNKHVKRQGEGMNEKKRGKAKWIKLRMIRRQKRRRRKIRLGVTENSKEHCNVTQKSRT